MPQSREVRSEEASHIHDHPDWAAVQVLIARETAIGKALASVMPLLELGVRLPEGNLAELQHCMIEAGYIDPEGRPIK